MSRLVLMCVATLLLVAATAPLGCDRSADPVTQAGGAATPSVQTVEARYLEGHTDGVHGVAFSPDGKKIATAGHDRTARLWDADTGKEIRRLEGHTDAVYAVSFSADGRRVVTSALDGSVFVWDVGSGELVAMLEGHAPGAVRVGCLPDDTVISAGRDGSLRQWDVAREQPVWAVRAGPGGTEVLAVSRDGDLVATGGSGGVLSVWDMRIRRLSWRVNPPNDEEDLERLRARQEAKSPTPGAPGGTDAPEAGGPGIQTVAFSADGLKVYSQTYGGPVHEWDAITGKHLRHLQFDGRAETIDVSPNGKWLLVDTRLAAPDAGGFHLFDLQGMSVKAVLAPNDVFHQVAFSPDGRRATAARGGKWVGKGWVRPDDPRVPVWEVGPVTGDGSATTPASAPASAPERG